MKTQFVCLVWGQKYVEAMLNYCLPSLLAPGNMPDWPFKEDSTLMFYTTSKDWLMIKDQPIIQELKQWIKIDKYFIESDAQHHDKRHNQLTSSHEIAVNLAIENKQSLFFMAPDHIYSSGCLTTLSQALQAGKELVITLSPRVIWESIEPELLAQRNQNQLILSPDQCADLFIKYMHSINQHQVLGHSAYQVWLSHIYCWLSPTQLQARGFHLHPIFIKKPLEFSKDVTTIDGHYLDQYLHQLEKVQVIQDNQFFILSLTLQKDWQELFINQSLNIINYQTLLDRFRKIYTCQIHQFFFENPITITTSIKHEIERPKFPIESIDALELFWKIETLFINQQYHDLIDLSRKNRPLIDNYLNCPPFNIINYFISQAGDRLNSDTHSMNT